MSFIPSKPNDCFVSSQSGYDFSKSAVISKPTTVENMTYNNKNNYQGIMHGYERQYNHSNNECAALGGPAASMTNFQPNDSPSTSVNNHPASHQVHQPLDGNLSQAPWVAQQCVPPASTLQQTTTQPYPLTTQPLITVQALPQTNGTQNSFLPQALNPTPQPPMVNSTPSFVNSYSPQPANNLQQQSTEQIIYSTQPKPQNPNYVNPQHSSQIGYTTQQQVTQLTYQQQTQQPPQPTYESQREHVQQITQPAYTAQNQQPFYPSQPTAYQSSQAYEGGPQQAQSPSHVRQQQEPLNQAAAAAQVRSRGFNLQQPQLKSPQQMGSLSRQNSADRVPGKLLTAEEWNGLHCPVDLEHDSNFFPSNGPDVPAKPPINFGVNCSAEYMQCSLTTVPVSSKLQSQCRLPLGLLVHPFRDVHDLPVIQTSVIVRCRSCRTYINPFVKFLDNGRRWRCPVCTLANTVPDEFFYDPCTQTYGDPSRRPEIRSATVEFIAPSEYMLRPPQAATYLFCLEVSHNAVATGYLEFVANMLADQLTKLPGDSRRQIGLLTYDSGIHFYILSGKSMRMVINQDLSEVFLPDMEGMINRINEFEEPITKLLRNLSNEFAHTQDTSNCLGFVLQTALKLIGSTGGRVTVFNTSLPNIGPGVLNARETREDQMKPDVKHLGAASDFYKTIALDFAAAQISVDLFLLNSGYIDIATISGVSRHSGGSVYHYPSFHYSSPSTASEDPPPTTEIGGDVMQHSSTQPAFIRPPPVIENKRGNLGDCEFVEVERLRRDLLRYLTRKIGFEAVLRIRCTRGLSIQNFFGNFFVRSVDLLSLPNVNPDAGFALQLEINENLDGFSVVVFQAALLYTSAFGDRRIRVHTLCLPVTDSPEAIFNYADQSAVACLVTKMAVDRTISTGLSDAREALTTVMGDILTAYQKNRRRNSNSISNLRNGSLCPASLRLLPVYLNGALRYTAFRTHVPVELDNRSAALELLIGASCQRIMALIYPRLYAIHPFLSAPICGKKATLAQKAAALSLNDADNTENNDDEENDDDERTCSSMPSCLPLTAKSVTREGVYLLETGHEMLLLVGSGLTPGDMQSLLGFNSTDEIHVNKSALSLPHGIIKNKIYNSCGNEELPKRRLQALLNTIRRDCPLGTPLVIIRHDAPPPLRLRFVQALVDDRTESAPSYSEYLQMIYNSRS